MLSSLWIYYFNNKVFFRKTIKNLYEFQKNNISVEDSGEGVIDDNGNVVFLVKYSALAFKPLENEVIDGVVKEIMNVIVFKYKKYNYI